MKFTLFLSVNRQTKKMKLKFFQILVIFFTLSCLPNLSYSQDRIDKLKTKLENLTSENPGLTDKVDISVSDVSIQEFLRGVARNANLNISIDPSLQFVVINNFTDVKVMDILLFFCKEYQLDIVETGAILSVVKYIPPKIEKPIRPTKKLIDFEKEKELLTLDVKNDTLSKIVHLITDKTGRNIILSANLNERRVSGYIKQMPFDNALDKFAYANALKVEKTEDNFYIISEQNKKTKSTSRTTNSNSKKGELEIPEGVYFKIRNINDISVKGNNVDVYSILKTISDSLRVNYTILANIDEKASLNLTSVSYEEFLKYILEGTPFRYQKVDKIYVIGEKSNISIHETKIIYLNHRSVDKVVEIIPSALKTDVELFEFPELNALFVTGHPLQVSKVNSFVNGIDLPVPVVLIEVLLVDIYKSNTISTGINAGFGQNPEQTSQSILPGISYSFSTEEINNIFGKIDGLGWINLGKVTPDFYLAIQAMEENNLLKIRSTPKLSTLNGHSALLTSGETRYYKEERNNYIGTQNPALSSSYTWKPINADLSISIKPVVSGDENITLDIEVSQAEFQPGGEDNAPPGSITRGFKSQIRIKNQEMILLGGLDRVSNNKSGRGVPFLSRIPVLRWFFSSKTDIKTDNKFSVFIQPTVIY